MAMPKGWYPDPAGGTRRRWWDGERWTDTYQAPGGRKGASGKVLAAIAIAVGVLFIGCVALVAVAPDPDDEENVSSDESTTTTTEAPSTTDDPTTTTEPATTQRPATTAAPTTTTAPPTTTAPQRTNEQRVRRAVAQALDDSNRDKDPRYRVRYDDTTRIADITWFINESLTAGLTKDTARTEATDILKGVRESGVDYAAVRLTGTYPLVDQLGNETEDNVVSGNYPKDLIDRINFDGFDFKKVFEIADDPVVHPAFQY